MRISPVLHIYTHTHTHGIHGITRDAPLRACEVSQTNVFKALIHQHMVSTEKTERTMELWIRNNMNPKRFVWNPISAYEKKQNAKRKAQASKDTTATRKLPRHEASSAANAETKQPDAEPLSPPRSAACEA